MPKPENHEENNDQFHFQISRRIESIFEGYKEISLVLLSLVVLVLSLFSIYNVIANLFEIAVHQTRSLTSRESVQTIFETIFTVLIAFEFEETFLSAYHRKYNSKKSTQAVDHITPVLLIGILALVRHILTINLETAPMREICGISILILSLGTVYALLRRTLHLKTQRLTPRAKQKTLPPPV